MQEFQSIILIFHVIIAIVLVALILVQQGKGASMGSAFGSGASQTMFGSKGSAPFLMKVTVVLITLFFVTSLSLNRIATSESKAKATVAPTIQTKTTTSSKKKLDASKKIAPSIPVK